MKSIGMNVLSVAGLTLVLGIAGCNGCASTSTTAASDPADVNMAPLASNTSSVVTPVSQPARVLDQRQSYPTTEQGEQYPADAQYAVDEADQAPPPLPEYSEPAPTQENTLWTPGYWRNSRNGYYWVPGAWVAPPYAGALWTPGYWAADGSRYHFHQGYWGRHVGFYGGVPYGGGYVGTGYRGGYWNGNRFFLNQAVYHVDVNRFHDVYNQPERMEYPYGRASYNGGNGGIAIVAGAAELLALHEQHEGAVRYQYDLDRQAYGNRAQFYQVNHGRPEAYFATGGVNVGIGGGGGIVRQEIVQRPVVIDERNGFPGRGNAYGRDENHGHGGDKHGRKDEDHGRGHDDDHGRR